MRAVNEWENQKRMSPSIPSRATYWAPTYYGSKLHTLGYSTEQSKLQVPDLTESYLMQGERH